MLSVLQTLKTGNAKADRDLRLLCDKDWSSTSLGPMSSWPQDLLTLIYMTFLNPQPQLFFLGSERIFLYNTAYSQLLRDHHPAYFAKPYGTLERLQPHIPTIEKLFDDVAASKRPGATSDRLVFFDNGDDIEELFLSGEMIPLPPHLSGFHGTTEDNTPAVVAQRRNEFLFMLEKLCDPAKNLHDLLQSVLQSLDSSEHDIPFAVVYEVENQQNKDVVFDSPQSDEGDVTLRLAGSVGDFDCSSLLERLELGLSKGILSQRMREAITSREPVMIQAADDAMLSDWCRASRNRGYGDECKRAVVFSTSSTMFHAVNALVVIGIAPRRPYDQAYQAWIREIQKRIANYALTITCTEARELEKRKAADRALEEADINRKELQFHEKEAIEANAKTKSILAMAETIDVGFFDYLPTGELIQGNNAFYELSGYPREPDLNQPLTFLDYCMPEDAEMVLEKWKWLMSGKQVTFDMRWKNGTPTGQWVQAACTPVFDQAGNIISISGCTTDISATKGAQEAALKRAEALEQVRVSQARLLHFTENTPIGIVLRDYPEHNLADGSFQGQAWVSVVCFPEYNEHGHLIKVMSTWTDISHSQFEEHLQRQRLEEAIQAKRSAEAFIDITSHEIRNPLGAIVHCADMLKDSLIDMRRLIDSPVEEKPHDTKAPLEEHVKSGIEAVDTILSCSMHQKRVTDDILSLSKLDSNLLQVAPTTVRATEMVEHVAQIFKVEADRVGVRLETQVDRSISELNIDWVVADSGRITQVLVNLVTNAIKFTKPSNGERTVAVRFGASKERPVDLSVTFAAADSPEARMQPELATDASYYLWFSVTDSGCGMSDEEQTRMFSRFSQASPKTYNQYGGSGLGLFISKRLVELQGGQIGLASQVDVGSRFAFYVPAKEATRPDSPKLDLATSSKSQTSPSANTTDVAQPSPGLSILIVEDNLVNQKVLQKQLTKLGYRVQTANHGQEALDYLTSTSAWKHKNQDPANMLQDVDVVLMDIEMPVMDGLTCSRRIREMQATGDIVRHIPIIAVSANARTEQTDQAYDAGVDDFIVKPFRIPELISVITRTSSVSPDLTLEPLLERFHPFYKRPIMSETALLQDLKNIANDSGHELVQKRKELEAKLEAEIAKRPADNSQLTVWTNELREMRERCKQELNTMMDSAMNRAMDVIESLPEFMREPAADAFTSSCDYIMQAVSKLLEFVNKAWDAIVDVWRGVVHGIQIWVEGAVDKLKEWASDALRACDGALTKVDLVFTSIFGSV
ncbi:hypothetical protein E4T48_07905 [Aureobasidium sp. EXF-10727]|nr:hypothetical protein E4T48_07905 [Aureobasidium sp. EXF-10727]